MQGKGYTEDQVKKKIPSTAYLNSIIKTDFPFLVFPKETRMGKCRECVALRNQISDCWKSQIQAEEFKAKFKAHLEIQTRERAEFAYRIHVAENDPSVLMLISDSPAMLGLPNLPRGDKTKEIQGKAIAMRMTGLTNCCWPDHTKKLKLFMEPARLSAHTQNYSISLLDKLLPAEMNGRNEPPKLLILQTDRGPEYNNQGFLQFLGLLLLTGKVQGSVLYGRLPAGHRCVIIFFGMCLFDFSKMISLPFKSLFYF